MIKVNFKQPKYIFPLVIFVPLCALIYFVMQTFGGGESGKQEVATDRINMELPEARAEEAGDKMYEMSRRFGDEDAFTAVGSLGEEKTEDESLEHGYSEEELNRLDAAEAERIRQQQEMEELERSLAESRKHINSYAYGDKTPGNDDTPKISPVTWKRYNGAAMNGRKPSKADWVSARRKQMKRHANSERIPSPGYGKKKRNVTVRTLSSNRKKPTPISSTRWKRKAVRRTPRLSVR